MGLALQVFMIGIALVVHGSEGYNISPYATSSAIPPTVEGPPGNVTHAKPSNALSPAPQPNRSVLPPPPFLAPLVSLPVPGTVKGILPSLPPSTPTVSPPYTFVPPPLPVHGTAPSLPPSVPQRQEPKNKNPISAPVAPVPVASPPSKSPQNPPTNHPVMPPSSQQIEAPGQNASVPKKLPQNPTPSGQPILPGVPPSVSPGAFPVASHPSKLPQNSPSIHPTIPKEPPSNSPEPDVSPVLTPPSKSWKSNGMPVAAPPNETPHPFSAPNPSPEKTPSRHKAFRHVNDTSPPPSSPKSHLKWSHSPAPLPSTSIQKHHHAKDNIRNLAPSSLLFPPPSSKQGPIIPPAPSYPLKTHPKNRQRDHVPPPMNPAPSRHKTFRHFNDTSPAPSSPKSHLKWSHSPAPLPSTSIQKHHYAKDNITNLAPSSLLFPPPSSKQGPIIPPAPSYPPKTHPKNRQRDHVPPPMNPESHVSPASLPSQAAPPEQTELPFLSPKISPSRSLPRKPKLPSSPPIQALPPPPPNEDCSSLTCVDPLTNTPPGSPCDCVLPMQVGLRLTVALYTFFPLVSKLAEEIAVGVFMKLSQVRIMGANAASQDPEKTIVLINLVPLGEEFDITTAYLIFQRFWYKQVAIKTSLFGNYEVLYVRYPGLPPSPPSSINAMDGPYSGQGNNGRSVQPLGVDVGRRQHKNGLSGSVVTIIVLSASLSVILCCVVAWVFLFKHGDCQQEPASLATVPSLSKPSGIAASMFGSGPSVVSLSFGSSFATYTGSAKTFSSSDIERATDNFTASRILGEGGFGRVYSGVLDCGTEVAVKVLKRDDQQGGREFLAEVEMLSRLHHRNLVKLIGICTEERSLCLLYELIPNGSVESHLHGVDKETTPLDWGARMKIALGAARGLAYLHEDSSPRVIHRDFKSSNILLEHDFTPKVSDFGLARTALEEKSRHISTRVMGTFGYVAPEYAMTGHLLVKSDVYSYGVVLLELLTGRKPVDMSQPPGQENLVAWARPLLTNKEWLESIIDPSLGPDFPFDSIAKVAAIASMCVQPEVSHRPFMGEVVQALKLVCNERDENKALGSRSCSQEDLFAGTDTRISANSAQLLDPLRTQSPVSNYDSGIDVERGLTTSDLYTSETLRRQNSEPFTRQSSSGLLRSGRGRQLWQKMRRLSGGTVSEHKEHFRLWPGSH
ncbi:receptor-like serine/threonine-protein kinase ALE2 isoform X3 [Actinidia eriantha]|uniref:receptor-like serine/threonine-protein kinase ALE2 isoform X3 n=1 Tax=Actinidia eriantha TaxID=165200 RepID=UPI002586FF99|nr:receptor-like serine/threonine-protein kinase ALE2 isoform X3 [Actinidia eriantha]